MPRGIGGRGCADSLASLSRGKTTESGAQVWSSSDADDAAVRVGTGGSDAQVPLDVNFTGYKYWGFEGGNRWYFARTRFTPYLGYLVGINRHQDIRGTFVGAPNSSTPGLAAQDGKFFEKSWALSLGPTGGMLIGVGPIEVMAEVQLRYLGGLSDVDWLVEEGLKDINDESGRWSLPFVFGGTSILILPLESQSGAGRPVPLAEFGPPLPPLTS